MILTEVQVWADKIGEEEKLISKLYDGFSDPDLPDSEKEDRLNKIKEAEKRINEYQVKLNEELKKAL